MVIIDGSMPRGRFAVDITGRTFGNWTVVARAQDRGSNKSAWWRCRCRCGTERDHRGIPRSASCGCQADTGKANRQHRHASFDKFSPTYVSWKSMKQRCLNPNSPSFGRYGGRGIGICKEWMSFPRFLADMGERPSDGTIDRIDNDRGYEPGNCRWATRSEQQRNNARSILTSADVVEIRRRHRAGDRLASIGMEFGVAASTISSIVTGRIWKDLH